MDFHAAQFIPTDMHQAIGYWTDNEIGNSEGLVLTLLRPLSVSEQTQSI